MTYREIRSHGRQSMLGGHAVAQCLRNEGVKHVFSVPGESYIAVVDGLVDFPEIKLITNRQEGCAAFMAEGYAKATRKPGVCIVTRGPGATNASIAVHSAKYDSAPMVLLVGSGTQYTRAWQEVIDFSERFQVPVVTSYKRQDAFPNNHPNYAGNLLTSNKETQRLAYDESDLLIVLGCRLNQQTTGAFTFPRPGRPFVQIDADEENLGQNARPEVGIIADAKQTLLAALKHPGPRPNENRAAWIAEQHAKQKDFSTPQDRPTPKVSMERVMKDIKSAMPPDAITTTDAGSFGQWPQRYIEFDY